MLAKLILIRACTYDLAELDFSHGDSMQLVGGNNVGKSSLIYALNFLFVINRKRMSFMGRKPADKTTMEYYFPTAESSFLIFEISKRGRHYCIIVWRDGEGSPRYARLDHAYQRDLFFKTEEDRLQPLSLNELRKIWLTRGVKLKLLSNIPEITRYVYHAGRANDAVVWLKNSGHGKGAEGFSTLYRYLIDTKLITDTALREILLLADHRVESKLTYGSNNLNDIERLRQQKSRLDLLRRHQQTFEKFRHDFQQLAEAQEELKQLAVAYRFHSTNRRAQIEEARLKTREELLQYTHSREAIQDNSRALQQQIGGLHIQIERGGNELEQLQQLQKNILALPTASFLNNSHENLLASIRNIDFQLTEAEQSQSSVAELKRSIARANTKIDQLSQQRDNLTNWLIFHLAESDQDRRRLNALLSPAAGRLDAAALRRKIVSTDQLVELFGGAFALPADFELPELPTPEQLAAEIAELKEQDRRHQRLLTAAQNRAKLEAERTSQQSQLATIDEQIRLLQSLPDTESKIQGQQQQLTDWTSERTQLEATSRSLDEELGRLTTALHILKENQRGRDEEEQIILDQLRKLEGFQLDLHGVEYVPKSGRQPELKRLFTELAQRYQQLKELINGTTNSFQFLKRDLLSETANEQQFIEEIEQDYLSLDDRAASVDNLVDNISQRFSNPAADFLHQYDQFRDFINQQFNRSLAKLRISNIEALRIELVPNDSLQRDLRRISELDLTNNSLFQNERGGISVLRRYIEQGKDIAFSELFSLQLKLTIDGKEKTVDLGKQVESDGTDRMLRLVIVMQVISRLVDLSPENRIVMFIDEIATIDGKNRPQLVAFCRDNHFYPIFAAPEMVEGFDRYVLIKRSAEQRLVVEADKNYFDVERN